MLRRETQQCSCKARLTDARDAHAVGFSRFPRVLCLGIVLGGNPEQAPMRAPYSKPENPESLRVLSTVCISSKKLSQNPSLLTIFLDFWRQKKVADLEQGQGATKNRSERSRCCAEKRSNANAKRGSQAQKMPAQ